MVSNHCCASHWRMHHGMSNIDLVVRTRDRKLTSLGHAAILELVVLVVQLGIFVKLKPEALVAGRLDLGTVLRAIHERPRRVNAHSVCVVPAPIK